MTTSAHPADRARRGLLLVCVAGVLWGTIGIAVRLVHERSGLSSLTISAYRTTAAVVVLVGAVVVRRRWGASWTAARTQGRRLVVVGVFTAAFQLLYFTSVVAIGVSVATVVCLGFAPVLLLVVGCVRRRRRPYPTQLLTVTMALVGLVLVSLADTDARPTNLAVGLVAALAAGAAFALSAEIAQPLSRRLDTLTITTATMTVAAVVLVPAAAAVGVLRGATLTTTDGSSWPLMIYLGVVTMALAYALLYAALRSTSSGVAMIASLLEPVTAVFLAVLLLDERLTPAAAVGCLLIVAAIGSLGRRAEIPPP
jgi:DME family drug/metabolite transporter